MEAKPTSRARVKEQLDFLEEVHYRFGYPVAIITDGSASYKARIWQDYLREHRIQHLQAAIYHQQANPVERNSRKRGDTQHAAVQ